MSSRPTDRPLSAKDYQSGQVNDWCAGCGDHGILRALQNALAGLAMPPEQVAVFAGIGCSGKTPYYLNGYGVHTLHGRLLPFATGAKLADPELTVIAVGGDGDGLSIGAGHFVNIGRRNLDLTYILFNNGVYGLTKGQLSPTLRQGAKTRSMVRRNIQGQINPILLAISVGFTWVGRGYAYDVKSLSQLIRQAINHPGIAYLDVLQPCPMYNDLYDKAWYAKRLYDLQEAGHEPLIPAGCEATAAQEKRLQCLGRAQEWGEQIPTGVFLQDLSQADFLQLLTELHPAYTAVPPARQPVADAAGRPLADLRRVFAQLTL